MDTTKTYQFVKSIWDESIIPTLCEYVKIPNVSPSFDKDWKTNGLLDQAAELMVKWVQSQNVPDLQLKLLKLEGRTPLIFITVPPTGECKETILMYGHLDKQPPLTETWKEGLGPYTPVIRDGKLYGRGSSDDGYAIFASVASLKALKSQGVPHGRIVIIIEACEESGSFDLPHYVEHLSSDIGTPNLVVCLDSGCGNYEQFWLTTSLRGMIVGNLHVNILNDGVHSGHASGIVPDSFRIVRQLLSRLEDEKTGEILPKEFYCEVPEHRIKQVEACAQVLGSHVHEEFPFVEGAKPVHNDVATLIINRSWKPILTITGVDGVPSLVNAGNVLRTHTSVKLSLRVPPRLDAPTAAKFLKEFLEKDPPYGAKVRFDIEKNGSGWDSPELAGWLEKSLRSASNNYFKKDINFIGEGGSIPFMGMLGKRYPEAQFVITGVLGPESNAHGPNEMLHIDMATKLTCCIAELISTHYLQFKSS